jgi:hypothetical protein
MGGNVLAGEEIGTVPRFFPPAGTGTSESALGRPYQPILFPYNLKVGRQGAPSSVSSPFVTSVSQAR